MLTALAGALIAAHLRMPVPNLAYCLSRSSAAVRMDERMAVVAPSGPVEINLASPEELETLVGVGPAIAQRIVEEREANGPFHYPEDLLAVNGIGAKTLEKIRPQISINK